MTDVKPYRHRFPTVIIQHAVWLYHRFPLTYRDVQELLYQHGIQVSHETFREWCIKFASPFAEELRQRDSRWHIDEVCTSVDGVRRWLWRAFDEHGFVQGILLQRHRDTEAARSFLTRLLSEYAVPDTICTDQLRSYGTAIREIPRLADVNHQQVISTARCNNIVEQSHRPIQRQERQQQGFKWRKRAQEFLRLHARLENLHHHARPSVSAVTRRNNQRTAFETWSTVAAGWPELQATAVLSLPSNQLLLAA